MDTCWKERNLCPCWKWQPLSYVCRKTVRRTSKLLVISNKHIAPLLRVTSWFAGLVDIQCNWYNLHYHSQQCELWHALGPWRYCPMTKQNFLSHNPTMWFTYNLPYQNVLVTKHND
jgi:hypothetical protein